MRNDQLVVIGGGPAGISAIETIRLSDGESPILLISDEPAHSRMALPYLLAGEIQESRLLTGSPGYFQRLRVTTLFGRRVNGVDPAKKLLALDDGRAVPFGKLLISTGSRPISLDLPGAKCAGASNLWSLDDARAILQAIKGRQARVVLVGAGFVGLIVLGSLIKAGCHLSLVESEPRILPRMLDRESAEMARGRLEKKGVRCVTGVTVVEIAGGETGKIVKLSDGSSIAADLVVTAVGVKPNIDLVKGSGIKTNKGILVDDHLRTNFPEIYAAGDAAEGPDLLTGEPAVHAIQPTAVEHGRVAGANMAGGDVSYPGSLSMNLLDIAGLQAVSLGLWRGDGGEATVVSNPARPVYRKLVWEGDRIAGAIFLGPARDLTLLSDVGMVKGLIQARTPLGAWKRYLQERPLDIRRPYMAAGVAAGLLETTLLGTPAGEKLYRSGESAPAGIQTEAHSIFVRGRPEADR
jgi:NAD(P)H-nitrite reductase large subunit